MYADGVPAAADIQTPDNSVAERLVLQLVLHPEKPLLGFHVLPRDEHAVEKACADASARGRCRDQGGCGSRGKSYRLAWRAWFAPNRKELPCVWNVADGEITREFARG